MKKNTLNTAVLAGAAALALFFARPCPAASGDVATAAGQFLKVPVGAAAVAMGSAYSAAVRDATAVYWNPAALTEIEGQSASLMHAALFDSVSLEFLGYARRFKGLGAFGFGFQSLSAGSVDKTDSSGFKTGGSFSPADTAFTVAYAGKVSGFSAGVSAKYIRSRLVSPATALAADLGLLSPAYAGGRLVFALVAQNLGGKLKYDQASEPLPRNIRLGGALKRDGGWLFGLDLSLPSDNKLYAGFGGEKRFDLKSFSAAVRAGYNTQAAGDVDGLTGLSTGFGVEHKKLRLDYALLLFGDLGPAHRLSIAAAF